jgi:hypothetical protein
MENRVCPGFSGAVMSDILSYIIAVFLPVLIVLWWFGIL